MEENALRGVIGKVTEKYPRLTITGQIFLSIIYMPWVIKYSKCNLFKNIFLFAFIA